MRNYVVNLAPHGSEKVAFYAQTNNTYDLQAQNADGDVVALVRVRVKCALLGCTGGLWAIG